MPEPFPEGLAPPLSEPETPELDPVPPDPACPLFGVPGDVPPVALPTPVVPPVLVPLGYVVAAPELLPDELPV